jgi:hypothetical protein
MTAPALRIVVLLACVGATSAAQPPPSATEILEDVTVTTPQERERERGPRVAMPGANDVTVRLDKTLDVGFRIAREQAQVVFRRSSAARRLPEIRAGNFNVNGNLRLELLPDRLIALSRPWIRAAGYVLAANVDESDGAPAHITFGAGIALVNLDHVSMLDSQRKTSITVSNVMHPQTRKCVRDLGIYDFWSEGTNPYVLLATSQRDCDRAVQRREGDLLFAEDVPGKLRQAVQELYDPIASRVTTRLGSEPGTMFVAWWPGSPHNGYRLKLSWNRNSLLLFNGSGWQQGIDAAQRDALRLSLTREQIQRRIRDWPGPFTQSAVNYLLLLTYSGEGHTTSQRLNQELPTWINGCAGWLQQRRNAGNRGEDVYSLECGLLLQFVYDAVARSRSAGKRDIYDTWRTLLDESFRRGQSGAKPADFLASSSDARRIAQGLLDGNMDWPGFAAALNDVGVKLNAVSGVTSPAFEVRLLEHFGD